MRIDLLSRDLTREACAWMRAEAPVYLDAANELYGIATYDGVLEVSRDPLTFSSAGGSRPKIPAMPWMIDLDGAEHSTRRKLVSSAFTPARVRAMREHVEGLCDGLIDEAIARQADGHGCDLVPDLAAPLPMIVIGDLLGVPPDDRAQLLRWSDDLLASLSGEPARVDAAAVAFVAFDAYARATIEARRRTPADDLVSVLVQAEVDGERLTDDQIVFEALLILVGGDETTRHVISGGIHALLTHPAERRRLAEDPGLLGSAVEEMLRWVSPIKDMARTVTRDVELAGTPLRAGAEVILLYESANFDESHFTDPMRFDIGRTPNDHLAFGFGPHHCLGAALARLEIEAMVGRILHRLPALELASEEGPERFLGALRHLPVRF